MTVYLVGAGPGDPGLLTLRGAEVLGRADVVVYDRLAEPSLLGLAPADAERIDVGKRPGSPVPQEDINRLLVERGRAGLQVVRLKGGDPFVLGRGGEEAEALAHAGVPFEVVPGITSAVAVPAYAGIPVTHRGLSTSFTVVTGHSRHAVDDEIDWDSLARAGDTVVVLMGVAHRAEIAKRLMEGGRSAATPVAAVFWGTRPDQRTVRMTLAELGDVALEPPVTMVIGEVAGLELGWFEQRALFGRRVVVTRASDQASSLVARLRELGADVVELPTIVLQDPDDGGAALRAAAQRVSSYDWVVFTSANAVARFLPLLRDARSFGAARIAAIGPGTAAALAAHNLAADLVPQEFVAESLLEAFAALPQRPGRVLLPRAAAARDVFPEGLRQRGWEVDVVEAYRTTTPPPPAELVEAARGADAVTFTSSSTVSGYLAAVGPEVPPIVACIGPITARTARDAGLDVTVVAEEHSLDGLVHALTGALLGAPRGPYAP